MKVSRCCVAMSPHPSLPSKKYVCKQTFDCCREYKCMWDCIAQKSYSELSYIQSSNISLLINPPRNPEYWYSTLKSGSMWMRLSELYFLHVQYNFKQSPLCESCQGPEWWQELLVSLVLLLNIYFLIIWAASFFLFFSFLFSFNIPRDTFWQSDRSRLQNNFCHLCNTTCKINKLCYIYLTACCFGHYLSCYPCFLAI